MYTQCPECKKQQPITVAELRSTQNGMIACQGCSSMYDALEYLNDGSVTDQQPTIDRLPLLEKSAKKQTRFWVIGVSLCFFLLAFQIYLFEGFNITQNQSLRPLLEKTCHLFKCQLPVYKNLSEFTILHASFEPSENDHYLFKTTIVNESNFKQNHPQIKLTLMDFNGFSFAERVFRPQDYAKNKDSLIESQTSVDITLKIAMPANKVGGYRFELI